MLLVLPLHGSAHFAFVVIIMLYQFFLYYQRSNSELLTPTPTLPRWEREFMESSNYACSQYMIIFP